MQFTDSKVTFEEKGSNQPSETLLNENETQEQDSINSDIEGDNSSLSDYRSRKGLGSYYEY